MQPLFEYSMGYGDCERTKEEVRAEMTPGKYREFYDGYVARKATTAGDNDM